MTSDHQDVVSRHPLSLGTLGPDVAAPRHDESSATLIGVWNRRHFDGRLSAPVVEFLRGLEDADASAHEFADRAFRLMRVSGIEATNISHLAAWQIGVIAPQGHQHGRKLATLVEQAVPELPECVVAALLPLVERLRDIEAALDAIDRRIADDARANADARLLMTIPGVGPLKASAIVATLGDRGIHQFNGAKNFAAWLGLTPGQHGTGGKARLGRITKMGDRYLRKLFVVGAHTVLIHADKHDDRMRQWAKKLRSTKKIKLAAVALANKTARIAYAVLATQKPYAA